MVVDPLFQNEQGVLVPDPGGEECGFPQYPDPEGERGLPSVSVVWRVPAQNISEMAVNYTRMRRMNATFPPNPRFTQWKVDQFVRKRESFFNLGNEEETCKCDFVSVSNIRQAAESAGSLRNQDTYAVIWGLHRVSLLFGLHTIVYRNTNCINHKQYNTRVLVGILCVKQKTIVWSSWLEFCLRIRQGSETQTKNPKK